ncbi:MAG TPA: PfkB family carbohydrate kinase [Bryobacteraceae bacterium]|nr:PfkB family carbohydrate kinase [Bryobacteraceae bacterium]
MNIVSIGEILWDVFPSSEERLGGAPFNFSANAVRLGHAVAFVSGVGSDARGEKVLEEMARLSTSSRYVRKVFDAPTGTVTVSFGKDGEPDYVLHRPAAYDFPVLDDADLKEIRELNPEWVYYGTLSEVSPVVHAVAEALLAAVPQARRFYDVNLRKGSDQDPRLLDSLLRRTTFAKLNESESARIANFFGLPPNPLEAFCEALRARYRLEGVCITLGADGCALSSDGKFVRCPGYRIRVQDAVGAGDAFAAALLHGMGSGWTLAEAGDFANRVGAVVASRAGAIPDWSVAECLELAL